MARIWLALLVSSSFASAQPVVPPMTDTPSLPQVEMILPNLFATTPGVTVDVRADYSDFDQIDASVFNVLAHVQYITPQGFGGYLRVPYGYVEDSDFDIVLGGKGIGNVEVGGLITSELAPETTLLGRIGVSIDTASEEDNFALLYSTILPRLSDVYSTALQSTWARGEAQIRHAVAPQLRVGGSIGADYPLAGDGADADEFDMFVHGTLCAGFEQGHLGVGASFVLVRSITDGDDENIKGANFSVDYLVNPQARVYFTIGLSLEDEADGTSFGLGARSSFR
jgi:hypothetical protein